MKINKILLYGYIGHRNFGDDLLFQIAADRCKNIPNSKLYVVITQPNLDVNYLFNYHPDLAIIRHNQKLPLLFFKQFNKVYFIGGGVFFDYRKSINLLAYLKNYMSNYVRFKIPKLFGTGFGGIGLGIGPYFNKQTLKLHKQIVSTFDILGVRDQVSYEIASQMKVKNLYLSNDLSIGFENIPKKSINVNKKEVVICPRTYHHKPIFEKHLVELENFANDIERKGYKSHWIFLQADSEILVNKLKRKYKVTVWNPTEMTILDFITFFTNVHSVFSSRMHTLFIAGLVNTPFVAIELHPKLRYASELFYDNPIILNPLNDVEDYKQAFEKIKDKSFNKSKLELEKKYLDNLNFKFLQWLDN